MPIALTQGAADQVKIQKDDSEQHFPMHHIKAVAAPNKSRAPQQQPHVRAAQQRQACMRSTGAQRRGSQPVRLLCNQQTRMGGTVGQDPTAAPMLPRSRTLTKRSGMKTTAENRAPVLSEKAALSLSSLQGFVVRFGQGSLDRGRHTDAAVHRRRERLLESAS